MQDEDEINNENTRPRNFRGTNQIESLWFQLKRFIKQFYSTVSDENFNLHYFLLKALQRRHVKMKKEKPDQSQHPPLQFQANVNDFRSNNRANQLRNLSNNNRIQQQLQNRQQPMRQQRLQRLQGGRGQSVVNQQHRHGNQVAIPITENINLGMNRMRGGLQAMRRRLDDLDSILDDIDSFQVETDQLVRNIQFIENIVERGQEDKKQGLTEAGLKKQKKIIYKKKDDQDTCSICIKNVAVDEQVYELICKHVFHEGCIDTWFKQSHVCPNCRKDLN